MEFEAVIGLEIHIQLLTRSKAFCADSTEYGGLPNTQVSPISLGHPGTLPRHNAAVVDKAITLGLALNCGITRINHYSRKNYFYADLPKGYQITQFNTPICEGGFVNLRLKDGSRKKINLIRIHMEEDTGKSMHDQDVNDSLVDFNRAGTALVEMVSEPEIRSGEEAYAFVTEVRKLVRHLGICDGNMEEGSLRCDANVSIRPVGSSEFGTKVEVKNMNSISNVKRAIDHEIQRQTEIVLAGGKVAGETRGFNALSGTTFSLRSKEMVNDYRYFPEPDLPPLLVSDEMLHEIGSRMPMLPEQLFNKFHGEFGLSEYDAGVLSDEKAIAEYYLQVCEYTRNYKAAANWVAVHIKGYLNENALELADFPLRAEQIGGLIELIDSGKLSNSTASQKVFPALVAQPDRTPLEMATELNVLQTDDSDFIESLVNEVLAKYPDKVAEYRAGKKSLLGLFVGEVMKNSKGKADPKKVNQVIAMHIS